MTFISKKDINCPSNDIFFFIRRRKRVALMGHVTTSTFQLQVLYLAALHYSLVSVVTEISSSDIKIVSPLLVSAEHQSRHPIL